MTVVEEQRNGNLEFTHLKFVEFLEFIGRVAHFFFEGTNESLEWTLAKRMQNIMEAFFAPLGLSVTPMVNFDELYSDSDDEY